MSCKRGLRRTVFVFQAEKSILAKNQKFRVYTFEPARNSAHNLLHLLKRGVHLIVTIVMIVQKLSGFLLEKNLRGEDNRLLFFKAELVFAINSNENQLKSTREHARFYKISRFIIHLPAPASS